MRLLRKGVLATVFAQLITNNGAAVLMFPVMISTAERLGVSVQPFVFALMVAAGSTYLSPVSYQTNLMVYGAGGYRFFDYARLGLPQGLLDRAKFVVLLPTESCLAECTDYMIDAAQRATLFWDVMRQRGNQFNEHNASKTPNVLDFEFEILMSGADLPRPVNYGLVRIIPPEGCEIDPAKRPMIVSARTLSSRPPANNTTHVSMMSSADAKTNHTYALG